MLELFSSQALTAFFQVVMIDLVLAGDNTRTVPVAVFNFMTFEGVNWGAVAAAATLICIPVFILALIVQRYIVSGLTLGAVKG